MTKVIVFDFEVFMRDVLLGVYEAHTGRFFQTWDKRKAKEYYEANKDAIWVGHNCSHYDNHILQAIVLGIDPYLVSKSIIDGKKPQKLIIPLEFYDTMNRHFASLKSIEAYMGKNISETPIPFDKPEPLSDQEKRMIESYNRDDLSQTFENLRFEKKEFQLRLDLAKEFKMPLSVLHMTEAQIAASVLGAKRIPNIENMGIEPEMPPNMRVESEEAKKFFFGKSWAWENGSARNAIEIDLCGAKHTIAAGGIHAGDIRHEPMAYYLDVSGYYNLVMINYDLLPRSIPKEGKKLYEYMYREQLKLKKKDPVKRSVYKTVLLAVFGAMNNEHCDFYDPCKGDMVRLIGEMFLIDLLEKLEPVTEIIQSNTDGIMVKPSHGASEADIKAITDEWQERTGFTLKFEKIYDIVQRDVNNYMYRDEYGSIHVKGEALKHWECHASPFECNSYDSKEPLIIAKCIVEYYMNGKKPEDVIAENAKDLRLFQFICKAGSYDYMELDDGTKTTKLQRVNRIFAGKGKTGVVYKCKDGKRARYPSVPGCAFAHNGPIEAKLAESIWYDYYAKRAYERIGEFALKDEQLTLF